MRGRICFPPLLKVVVMARKTYRCNVNEAVLFFALGKARVKAVFTGGSLMSGVPAHFSTSNEAAQVAIERDSRFGNVIFLDRTDGEVKKEKKATREVRGGKVGKTEMPEDVVRNEDEESGKGNETGEDVVVVEEVTDVNGVIEWLKDAGVAHQALRSVKGIRKAMEDKNVQFPNVQFPEE